MRKPIALAMLVGALAALAALVAVQVAGASGHGAAGPGPKAGSCSLGQHGKVKHVIYLQFDNVHFAPDRSNVAGDLVQMPHLFNFLKQDGTLFTNDHTILISHTAGGITSSLTGLYPDRMGQTTSNGYDAFDSTGTPHNTSSFKYWTDPVGVSGDNLPNMVTDGQKTTPAPWAPYTRAGCDVGGVGTANIELENTSTAAGGDITKVFGNPSPEATEANSDSQAAQTDFVGIAVHCSQSPQSVCANNANARPDQLPDEPGGYTGFDGLFGAKYVDPAVANGSPCVADTSGNPITDPVGRCGFPGFDGMLAKNSLGYVAAMQENGVPVTYAYISDAHDLHVPTLSTDSYSSSATGPGEITHEQQLKDYDTAFENFFQNLQQHGINKGNTLFVVTVDEGDHFAGGIGTPQQGSDNLIYDHRSCTNLTACPSNQLGEVGVNLSSGTGVLPAGESPFDIHFDDAPTVYVSGQPPRDNAGVRKLEQDMGSLMLPDPYVNHGQSIPAADQMADTVEEQTLHMVNSDPARTPTFTMFGNPDFFFQLSNPCSGFKECAAPGFAWNHGDVQQEIGNTWVGFVGPGIAKGGVDSNTWTDHTNVRPTILSLLGLKDDYTDDGHVLVQGLDKPSVPKALDGPKIADLEQADDQVNAPFGQFALATLASSTKALKSTSTTEYNDLENSITNLTSQRDTLAGQIRSALNAAAFDGVPISNSQAQSWIDQANSLISQAQALPH
ncbi:MAG TPA: hypothetical protein VHZ77_09450 [Gaiellaceae bacterium]|nr:hypothetical protein [Gaiellaceae bacterium]